MVTLAVLKFFIDYGGTVDCEDILEHYECYYPYITERSRDEVEASIDEAMKYNEVPIKEPVSDI